MAAIRKAIALTAVLLMMCSSSGCLAYTLFSTTTPELEYETAQSPIQELTEDLSRESTGQILTATVEGDFFYNIALSNASGNVLHNEVVGIVGCPLEITTDTEDMGKVTLTLHYNEDSLGDIPEENLLLLHYLEEECWYEEMPDAVLDADADALTAELSEDGVYVLVDSYVWYSAWGLEVPELAHDSTFTSEEFGFSVSIPAEISYTACSDYLKEGDDGVQEKNLIYVMSNDESPLQMEMQYKLNDITYDAHMAAFTAYLNSEENTDILLVDHEKKQMPNGMRADFIKLEMPLNGTTYYQCTGFYQLSGTEYIVINYMFHGYEDVETLTETAEASLKSFRMLVY